MSEIGALMLRIDSLPVAKPEEVLEVMAAVERVQAQVRAVKEQLEAALIDYIDHNGDIELGDKRWYVGINRTYKPRLDGPELLGKLMDAIGGDFDRFCELLAANAFKPGECKKVLGEEFDAVFETVVRPDLQTGKPKRVVKVHDARFAK